MKILATILVIATLLLECAACTSQPSTPAITQSSTPTITFEDDRCEYSGPDSIQADQFTFRWVMNGQQYEGYIVSAIQMEEGHSVKDLVGLTKLPSWISSLRYETGGPGPWTKEVTWDLTANAKFQPGPVYLVCDYKIKDELFSYGVAGSIEVDD